MVLLPVVALMAALFWLYSADQAVSAQTDKFTVGSLPGQVTVSTHPDTWYIYATSGATIERIQVFDPSGGAVPVKSSSAGTYMSGGRDFRAVGQFSVRPGQGGDFRVSVAGSEQLAEGLFAVGSFSVDGFRSPQLWAASSLLIVNAGAAIAIAAVPILRARRDRKEPAKGTRV